MIKTMKKINYIYIILVVLCFLNFSTKKNEVKNSNFQVITFVENSNLLTEEGEVIIDTLGKFLKFNEHILERGVLVLTPYNSEKEYNKNKFIGIERFRKISEILSEKYKLDVSFHILYNDKRFEKSALYKNKSGLVVTSYFK